MVRVSNKEREKQKQDRLGEVRYNSSNERMIIIEYNSANDITVQFDNGFKAFKVIYKNFKKGNVLNPINKPENRIGEINYNNHGNKMIIIEYNNNKDIKVELENGYITGTTYAYFKNGSIETPYDRTVCNIGYIGEGDYAIYINGIATHQYTVWCGIIQRCYNEKRPKKYSTYKDCTVCEEWHCFQTFAKWYDENYYTIDNHRMCVDKDILYKGNKIYSPDTCVIVPENINTLFVKSNTIRGDYPIGVYFNKRDKKYVAQCKYGTSNKYKFLGYFNTPEEAFNIYKQYKEKLIKKIADKYKNRIPQKLYDAMYRYEVEITD